LLSRLGEKARPKHALQQENVLEFDMWSLSARSRIAGVSAGVEVTA
jgi:hypothetical protein